jgi:hypothetical protein
MSFRGKRELLVQVAPRYSSARHGQRSVILDEFVAVTGYDRKYAIRLLLGPIRPPAPIRRPRAAHYGSGVQQALSVVWSAANGICAKRLVPFLPELVPTLERPWCTPPSRGLNRERCHGHSASSSPPSEAFFLFCKSAVVDSGKCRRTRSNLAHRKVTWHAQC